MHKYAVSWRLLNLSVSIWELRCAQWKDLIGLTLTRLEEQSSYVREVPQRWLICIQIAAKWVFSTDTLQ